MRLRFAFVCTLALLLVVGSHAGAQTTLTGGRTLTVKVKSGGKSSGTIGFVKDPELVALVSPLCPTTSALRRSSTSEVKAEIALPCANW